MDIKKASSLAVQNVLKEGLTDIFDHPFELSLLKNTLFQKKLLKTLASVSMVILLNHLKSCLLIMYCYQKEDHSIFVDAH